MSPVVDRRPLVLASGVALLSIGVLVVAIVGGWLGPDVGRGAGFCEAARRGLVKQPANTWSNVGFVVAGLLIGRYAGTRRGEIGGSRAMATAFAVVVVLLGPGSAAMHATQTSLGGHLDLASMYLVSSFAAAHALTLATMGSRASGRAFAGLFTLGLGGSLVVERLPGSVPVLMAWGNVAFAGLLGVAAAASWIAWRRGLRADLRWVGVAVGAIGLAFAIWNLSKDGTALCHPHSLLQGHAIWHLLCAVAAYGLYRAWVSERWT